MKVVLLKDIKGIGRRNEVKEVNGGYARNFLIAKKLAAPATPEMLAKKAEDEKHEVATMKKLRETASRLAKETLFFFIKAGERGAVFGSVTKEDVRKALRERGYDNVEVLLPKSIKALGHEIVEVDLGQGVKSTVKIAIAPTE